jgi:hypothetical protein
MICQLRVKRGKIVCFAQILAKYLLSEPLFVFDMYGGPIRRPTDNIVKHVFLNLLSVYLQNLSDLLTPNPLLLPGLINLLNAFF